MGTGVSGTGGMGWGGLIDVSKCQKDVKLSKRCQIWKSQICRLWRRFTKKINWHHEVHTYWHQFWCQIWCQNCSKILSVNILRVFSDHHLWRQNWRQYLWTSLCQFIFFVNLLHSPGVWFLTFDIFLTTWHLFDNLTSFWHSTYNMGTWWTCAGSCVQWILPIPIRSRWGTGAMGHMGNGAHGQLGTWA